MIVVRSDGRERRYSDIHQAVQGTSASDDVWGRRTLLHLFIYDEIMSFFVFIRVMVVWRSSTHWSRSTRLIYVGPG